MSVQAARGMRDFLPDDTRRRNWVSSRIQSVFQRYGYEPLETPAVERIETLLGKYGEEGDQLLFKILKRGEGSQRGEVDLGLRYDLTVPLARVVAMNSGKLVFPFKRYQMSPVWRADRPQRGRYREFVQCDVDVVGTTSLVADAELVAVAHDALTELGFANGFQIHINHRQVLRGIVESAGVSAEREGDVLVALDKLDKIGADGVRRELEQRGFSAQEVAYLSALIEATESRPDAGLDVLREFVSSSETGCVGMAQLNEMVDILAAYRFPAGSVVVSPVLARGLSYYTGPVFEATISGFSGSVAGGGRYDNLVGMFMGQSIPATGISLGFERLLVIMEERGMFTDLPSPVHVLVSRMGAELLADSIELAQQLRATGVSVELVYDDKKLAKQLKHADARSIPLVAIVGPDEKAKGTVIFKDLRRGVQHEVPRVDAGGKAKQLLADIGVVR